jgi:hypothetical protein
MEYYSVKKPGLCPKCGSKRIAEILYGFPDSSPELNTALKNGTIVIGGCEITGHDAMWQCVDCNAEIFQEQQNKFNQDIKITFNKKTSKSK